MVWVNKRCKKRITAVYLHVFLMCTDGIATKMKVWSTFDYSEKKKNISKTSTMKTQCGYYSQQMSDTIALSTIHELRNCMCSRFWTPESYTCFPRGNWGSYNLVAYRSLAKPKLVAVRNPNNIFLRYHGSYFPTCWELWDIHQARELLVTACNAQETHIILRGEQVLAVIHR